MKQEKQNEVVVELDRTDLATLLRCLASDLRNAGMAVRGTSYRRAEPDEQELSDMDRLAGSLERVAVILDASRERLCKACRLIDVSERILLGAEPLVR